MTFDQYKLKLRKEVLKWFKAQFNLQYAVFYCYYLPVRWVRNADKLSDSYTESDVIICEPKDKPDGYKLVSPERVNGFATVDANYARLVEASKRLPIIS